MGIRHKLAVRGRFWLNHQERNFLGRGRIELLEKVAEYGSISQAAKAMNMSYKAAWDAIDAMNNLAQQPLVIRSTGGKKGGGTQLTDYAHHLISAFHALETEHEQFLEHLTQQIDHHFYQLMRLFDMQTSARNQYVGTVVQIKQDTLTAEVTLKLRGNNQIVASITQESLVRLALKERSEVYAIIKAPHVILTPVDSEFEFSARNCLCGKVIRLTKGVVNAEVSLELTGGQTLKAIVTMSAINDLEITEGKQLCGIFKAANVILAVKKGK